MHYWCSYKLPQENKNNLNSYVKNSMPPTIIIRGFKDINKLTTMTPIEVAKKIATTNFLFINEVVAILTTNINYVI